MHGPPRGGRERILDPIDRTSEVLFGLIMALTFTSTFSAATAGPEETRILLYGAIGCNVAWGLVDAVMFLMRSITERGRGLQTIRAVHAASGREEAYRIIMEALSPVVASLLTRDTLESLRRGLQRMDDLPATPSLTREDWFGAVAVFFLVCFSTLPIVIPFVVIENVTLALRLSNLIAILMLFMAGYRVASYGGQRPWRTGLSVMVLGLALVGIAVALGG